MACTEVWTGPRKGGAVLGSPIGHSLSPALHREAYRQLGLSGWDYRAIDCDAEALPATLTRLERQGVAGVSLTMPLKRAVIPLLPRIERLAADVEAVNTVLFGGVGGEWWGGNTDVPALASILREHRFGGSEPPLLLGAGATAASAVAALAEVGVATVMVAARRLAAIGDLAAIASRFGVAVVPASLDPATLGTPLAAAPLVISTLPAGVADPLATIVDRVSAPGPLIDVVYAGWPTRLARAWSAHGGAVVGGLELLVRQAALQVRLMTGRDPDLALLRAAGERALAGID